MTSRSSHPDDDASLSDIERRQWGELARQIGPSSGIGNPRDYVPAPEAEEDFVPPEPNLPPTPRSIRIAWGVLFVAVVLIVMTAYFDWPWFIGLLCMGGVVWAIFSLLRRLPDEPVNEEPVV